MAAYPWYPQGDDGSSMNFGTAIFGRDLNGAAEWTHQYYQHNSDGKLIAVGGNGGTGHVTVYVQERPFPWIRVGTLASMSSITTKYSHAKYDYGTAYNGGHGYVFENVLSSWNKGTRISQYPMYPQGDTLNGFTYGTAIFSNGLNDQRHEWHHYYYQENSNGRTLVSGSNGDVSTLAVYVRQRVSPWQKVGSIGQMDSLVGTYPMNKYDYAVTYNAGMGDIHSVVINSWNKGTRLTCFPHYAQNDNIKGLVFGTAVFVQGTNGQSKAWQHYYYQENGDSKTVGIGGNGDASGVSIYVSALPDSIDSC